MPATPTDAQGIFETVARHLFTQGERSVLSPSAEEADTNNQICAYRGDNGGMCAVGCLIPDQAYDPGMEGEFVRNVVENWSGDLGHLEPHISLLSHLQGAHDSRGNWVSSGAMRVSLRRVAKDHGLDHGFLNTLRFKDR